MKDKTKKAKQLPVSAVKTRLTNLLKIVQQLAIEAESKVIDEQMDAVATARLLRTYRDANDLADSIKKHIGSIYDYIRVVKMPGKMDDEGIDSPFNVSGVGRIVLTDDIRVNVLDKSAEYEWLEANGHGNLVTETVNAASLAALLRRYLRDGKTVPESVFKITPFIRASIVGGRSSSSES